MSGWTNRGSDAPVPRQDRPPVRFYEERIPADPACAAWDEPGYVDPETRHAGLPLGARYWQGFAKRCAPRRERAMSPEWVTRVTANEHEHPGPGEARGQVTREKETERLIRRPATFWPG
jgi:hypothetical protein